MIDSAPLEPDVVGVVVGIRARRTSSRIGRRDPKRPMPTETGSPSGVSPSGRGSRKSRSPSCNVIVVHALIRPQSREDRLLRIVRGADLHIGTVTAHAHRDLSPRSSGQSPTPVARDGPRSPSFSLTRCSKPRPELPHERLPLALLHAKIASRSSSRRAVNSYSI